MAGMTKDAPPRKPLRRMIRRAVPGTGRDSPTAQEPKKEGEAPTENADPAEKAEEKASEKELSGEVSSNEAPKP
jgi:hypothetical protein